MKAVIVGLWAVAVTLGAGWGAATFALSSEEGASERPALEGLQYTSIPTMSIPVVGEGKVEGYVVIRMVYTADTSVLKNLASEPDAFITDEVFRTIYAASDTAFGKMTKLDLAELADGVKTRVNNRMGDAVVSDLLVDGLNYIDLDDPKVEAAAAAAARIAGARSPSEPAQDAPMAAAAAPAGGGGHH